MQKAQAGMVENYKVGIFKLNTDEFEKYYNQRLVEHGCTVFPLSEFYNQSSKKHKIKIKHLLSLNLKQFDIVVVFDNLEIVPFLRLKMKPKAKLILWNWNKQNLKIALKEKFVSLFCEIWTFDSNDAKKYNWKLNNQFYIPITATNITSDSHCIRAFCACLDKGRYQVIKEIRNRLLENGVECDFTLVKDGTSVYDSNDSDWVKDSGIPYSTFLRHTMESDIIVDIPRSNQSGLTVRTLEALFYNKKLVTSNGSIRDYSFYCDSNILILDNVHTEDLQKFLMTEKKDIAYARKIPYTYEGWLHHFLCQ